MDDESFCLCDLFFKENTSKLNANIFMEHCLRWQTEAPKFETEIGSFCSIAKDEIFGFKLYNEPHSQIFPLKSCFINNSFKKYCFYIIFKHIISL